MKVLVLSDSHSALSFMRLCIDRIKPDAIVHLGDHFDDAQAIQEEYPTATLYQVCGNCDRYRCPPDSPEVLVQPVFGALMYMTHGHQHRVKQTLTFLLGSARASRAQAVLYGHTHVAECHREDDGLWVLNPGSCGYFGGSAGLMEVENKQITACRIIRQEDLEETV